MKSSKMTVVEETAQNGETTGVASDHLEGVQNDRNDRLSVDGSVSPSNYDPSNHVLHVVVVGFHHKKGCQVKCINCCNVRRATLKGWLTLQKKL